MKFRKVVSYATSDGKLWPTQQEARRQQAIIDSAGKLSALLNVTLTTGRREAILQHILSEHKEVAQILREFAKKSPKPQEIG